MAVNKDGVPEVLRKVIVIDSGDGPGLVKSGKCRQDAGIRGNTVNPGRGRRDSENSGPVIPTPPPILPPTVSGNC